ncbi:MAG: hypothetical protein ABIP24_02495 [Croceibacterium sp.]
MTAKGRFGVLAACGLVACIPSAGFAVSALGASVSQSLPRGTVAKFTPAAIDPRIALLVAQSGNGKARLMRFTPAGVSDRASSSMTVAVRVDEGAVRVVSVGSVIAAAKDLALAGTPTELRLAPMRYNLGLARGYQSFAKPAPAAPALSRTLSDASIPDLASFRPTGGVKEGPSRFVARNATSEPRPAAAPRTVDARDVIEAQAVDLAGSYRLTHNVNVTAGVRYQPEQDRLAPVADTAKKDNQAVYVGTQFRF